MKINTVRELFQEEIKDLHDAETRLVEALPKMIDKVCDEDLKEAIAAHLRQTENHVLRLEEIGQVLDFEVKGKSCKGMEGLLKEGEEVLNLDGDEELIDEAIIGAAQKVEHYEIAAYTSALSHATLIESENATKLLGETLDEEEDTLEKLSSLVLG